MGYKIGSQQKGFALGPIVAPAQPTQMPWEQSVTQRYALGCKFEADDGRVWHYGQVGAAAVAAGELQQSAAFAGSSATVQTDITPTAAAIGARTVIATLATDAAVKNLFADGWCSVSDGPGQGELYKIVSNKAAGAGADMTFALNRPLTTAWTSSTRLSLSTNLYKTFVQMPVTTVTGFAIGVPNIAMDIGYFGWLQTWGWCCVLIKTALLMGGDAILDVAAAGSLGVQTAGAGSIANATLGHTGVVVATTDSGLIYLQIAR